jgi:hypothetical protein
MAETFLFLLTAHLVADFVLQDRWTVRLKAHLSRRWPRKMISIPRGRSAMRARAVRAFGLHVMLVAGLSWLALASFRTDALAAVAVIALTHAAMDWIKLRWLGRGLWAFALDQAAHVSVIAVVAAAWPTLWGDGAWGRLDAGERQAALAAACALAGLIGAVRVGAVVLRESIRALGWTNEATAKSLPGAGAVIGQFERALILFFVLAGQPGGVALLIAAKAVLRIRDEDRKHSEYVIGGTLMSFGWALGVAALTQAALERWQPPKPAPSACVQCPGGIASP